MAILRRHGVLAISAATALLFSASGLGSTAASASSKPFGVHATGVVQFWTRSCTDNVAHALANQFNASHPGLKVEVTPIQCGTGAAVTKLATALRAGDPPDLDGIDDIDIPIFASTNSLMNLTPYMKTLSDARSLNRGQLNLGSAPGHYYSVPYLSDLSVLWYNKTLFKRAGLNPNDPPTNYAQILHDAKAISALGHGIYGFSVAGNCSGCSAFALMPMIFAAHRTFTKGPLTHQAATFTGNPPLTKLMQLMRTMWTDHLMPPGDLTQSGSTWGSKFLHGDVGIEPNGYGGVVKSLQTPAYRHMASVVADAPLPGPTGGASTYIGGDNFVIPNGAKNPSGAWEFVKWVEEAHQQLQFPNLGYTPVRTDLLTPTFKAKYPLDAQALAGLANGNALNSVVAADLDNTANSPWLLMLRDAMFKGKVEGGIAAGQKLATSLIQQAAA